MDIGGEGGGSIETVYMVPFSWIKQQNKQLLIDLEDVKIRNGFVDDAVSAFDIGRVKGKCLILSEVMQFPIDLRRGS